MGRRRSTQGTIQECTHKISVGKPYIETLGWPRRRWDDNIKIDLRKLGGDAGDVRSCSK